MNGVQLARTTDTTKSQKFIFVDQPNQEWASDTKTKSVFFESAYCQLDWIVERSLKGKLWKVSEVEL